jgi:hypothetical protein
VRYVFDCTRIGSTRSALGTLSLGKKNQEDKSDAKLSKGNRDRREFIGIDKLNQLLPAVNDEGSCQWKVARHVTHASYSHDRARPAVKCIDMLRWLEDRGYVSDYPGEWIVVSGAAAEGDSSVTRLAFHGKDRAHAMKTIDLVWKKTPEFWAVAIKVPEKTPMVPVE